MQLARDLGVAVAERPFVLGELLASEEAFLTSSLRGLAPLVRVDGTTIGPGTPGPLTRKLAAAHEALVEKECGESHR
jgi:branched-subunit amino acid aminotransferase/4-amino-4-deoxychorismate lyase